MAIPSFSIRELLPEQLERYYRYNGSLTTPPCSQSVLWSLLPQPVRISRAQVGAALRGEPRVWGMQLPLLPLSFPFLLFPSSWSSSREAFTPRRRARRRSRSSWWTISEPRRS